MIFSSANLGLAATTCLVAASMPSSTVDAPLATWNCMMCSETWRGVKQSLATVKVSFTHCQLLLVSAMGFTHGI